VADVEERLRGKHGAAVACLHESHEADLELLRRKLNDAQEDVADLRRAVARHKADVDSLTVRICRLKHDLTVDMR
jgi:phage shock protein A